MHKEEVEMKQKRILSVFLTLMMLFSISAFPSFGAGVGAQQSDVIVMYTNDVHGYYKSTSAVIGHDYISALKKQAEATVGADNVLMLDAGDATQGILFAGISKGESAVKVMNAVGYDAMTIGNHEFDYGMSRLFELAAMSDFPFLTNLDLKSNGKASDNIKPYKIFDTKSGLKVGVFGITTPETATTTNPLNVVGVDFGTLDSIVAYTQKTADALKAEKCDVVIALTHLGATGNFASKLVAEKITGVDVVIDGHSHTVMPGQAAGKAVITQTGTAGANVGVLSITKKTPGITATTELISKGAIAGLVTAPDATVTNLINTYQVAVDEYSKTVVANISTTISAVRAEVRTKETAIGNLATDAMRAATGADVAMTNGGGLRDVVFPAGNITKGHTNTLLPFGNVLRLANVSGQVLKDALEVGAKLYPEQNGAFTHVSGMTYKINAHLPAGSRVSDVTVNGKPLDLKKTYKLATNDFMADAGGDGYSMFVTPFKTNALPFESKEVTLDGVLAWYLNENKNVEPKVEGRITVQNGFKDVAYLTTSAIYKAASASLISGYPDGTFKPANSVTRGEFITMMSKALKLTANVNANPNERFSDVPATAFYYTTANTAKSLGIVAGVGGSKFNPNATITTQDMLVMLYNAMQKTNVKLDAAATPVTFTDSADVSDYAAAPVAELAKLGLVLVEDGKLEPKSLATRGEAAEVLANVLAWSK